MPLLRLPEFLRKLDDSDRLSLQIDKDETAPPTLVRTLWKLERLGLLRDDVILSLLAQPPIDPIGLYATLRQRFPDWPWTFNPLTFSVVCILAKRKDVPVALMTLDLLSDSVEFAAMVDGSLHGVKTVDGAEWGDKPIETVMALVEKTVEQGRRANQ
jgi:hypothetical protein